MIGRPAATETSPYYFGYVNRIDSDNIVSVLEAQLEDTLPFLLSISEEKSLHRYAPGKWSIRQTWNHVNDAERLFLFRALWFARGHKSALPSFDQDVAAGTARADEVSWASHIGEFKEIRLATLAFFRNLPHEAWMRSGVVSDNPFTVRACAYIVGGHVVHHATILRERYL